MSEPYDSIDALLTSLRPRMQRLLLREVLAQATLNPTITLRDIMKINTWLCEKRNQGEL